MRQKYTQKLSLADGLRTRFWFETAARVNTHKQTCTNTHTHTHIQLLSGRSDIEETDTRQPRNRSYEDVTQQETRVLMTRGVETERGGREVWE